MYQGEPDGRNRTYTANPAGVRLPYWASRLDGTKLTDPRTPRPAGRPSPVPTVRREARASAPTSYSVVGGTEGTTSSSAFFRTYSARPKTAFVSSSSRLDSSTTLFDTCPEPSGLFAPQISALAHRPALPNGCVVRAATP